VSLTINDLRARAEIADCLNRYSQGVDQRVWPLYHSAFCEDAQISVPGYLEEPLSPAAFRDMLCGTFDESRLSGVHMLGNSHISIDGEAAHAVTEFLAITLERTDVAGQALHETTAGLYVDDLVIDDGEWRIKNRVLSRKSSDPKIVELSEEIEAAVVATLDMDWWPLGAVDQESR
jgi:hypothetical protein